MFIGEGGGLHPKIVKDAEIKKIMSNGEVQCLGQTTKWCEKTIIRKC